MEQKDTLFNNPPKQKFEFNETVASVFDDMLERSVPFYRESVRLIAEFVNKSVDEGDRIYDLGSSTGTTLLEIHRQSSRKLELIGIDNAESMISRAEHKAAAFGAEIAFHLADLSTFPLKNAQIVLSNYTLQFIRPPERAVIVKKIYDSLNFGGLFIFSEKVISEDKILDKQMIDSYYAYKRAQGYSEMEIMQKREALENVLVPYSEQENRSMMEEAGFVHVETLLRWVNFGTWIARK